MRIVTGTYRGRQIPSGRRLRQIRLTSTRLKEAVFSMLGPNLKGRTFLDLCAGSGQMGLEALSRGASVELNEPDYLRRQHIRALLYQWKAGVAGLHSLKAQHLIPQLAPPAAASTSCTPTPHTTLATAVPRSCSA